MGPRSAAHPVDAIGAGIGSIELAFPGCLLHDAQIDPFTRCANDCIAVARIAWGNRRKLLGKLGLAGLPDRDLDQLDIVVT